MRALHSVLGYLVIGLLIWLSNESPTEGAEEALDDSIGKRAIRSPSVSSTGNVLRPRANPPEPPPWNDPNFERRYLEEGGPDIPDATNPNEEYGNCMFKWMYLRIRSRGLDIVESHQREETEAYTMVERMCYDKTIARWAKPPRRRLTKADMDRQIQLHRERTEQNRQRNGASLREDRTSGEDNNGQGNNGQGPTSGNSHAMEIVKPGKTARSKEDHPSLNSFFAQIRDSLSRTFASMTQRFGTQPQSGDNSNDGPLKKYFNLEEGLGTRGNGGGFRFRPRPGI